MNTDHSYICVACDDECFVTMSQAIIRQLQQRISLLEGMGGLRALPFATAKRATIIQRASRRRASVRDDAACAIQKHVRRAIVTWRQRYEATMVSQMQSVCAWRRMSRRLRRDNDAVTRLQVAYRRYASDRVVSHASFVRALLQYRSLCDVQHRVMLTMWERLKTRDAPAVASPKRAPKGKRGKQRR